MTNAHEPAREFSQVVEDAIRSRGIERGGVRLAHKDSHALVHGGTGEVLYREEREQLEEERLAEGATRARGAGDRAEAEEADEFRTCFERDLDRIKYSKAWRRLAGKCQVFVAPDDEHLRNRMTHALEVAQVAISIARPAGLNLALVEAIALGHDCGHGPGGHASEDAFEPYIDGGYDHASWGADVILAPLNLCSEVLDGVRQHSWRLAAPRTPEGEVVSLADRLAYVAHDYDDAVRAGIISVHDLPPIVRELCGERQSAQLRAFVADAIHTVERHGRVGISSEMGEALDVFRRFNYDRIYLRPASNQQAVKVVRMLRALVEFYADTPGRIPNILDGSHELPMAGSAGAYFEAVRYVSGMTDRFAIRSAVVELDYPTGELPRGV
jgi:dGTPase